MTLLWEHDVNQLVYPIPREIHQTWHMKQIDLITSLRGMTLPIRKWGWGMRSNSNASVIFLWTKTRPKHAYFQRPYSWKYIIHQNVIDQNWWCNQFAKYSTWFVISIIFFFSFPRKKLAPPTSCLSFCPDSLWKSSKIPQINGRIPGS